MDNDGGPTNIFEWILMGIWLAFVGLYGLGYILLNILLLILPFLLVYWFFTWLF